MKEMLITEKELDYYSKPMSANVLSKTPVSCQSKMSFEEEAKKHNCITLEEFSRMWDESIRRLIPNP